MKKSKTNKLLPQYDFSKGVRGKYAKNYLKGSLSNALRVIAKIILNHEKSHR